MRIQTVKSQGNCGERGEPLQSMNLDNPLKIVFPQEANQSALKGFEMPRFVDKKTVAEVWREKQRQQKDSAEPQRTARLGEMTLEDFLVKAGVETDGSDKRNDSTREPHWLQRQSQKLMLGFYVPSRPASLPIDTGGSNAILPSIYPDGQVNISPPLSSGRKRVVGDEMGETAMERRRKRMIKNRESAARSRARKQAYTSELENTILHLEEENEKLRKEKELDIFLHNVPLPEPKQELRRSISAPI